MQGRLLLRPSAGMNDDIPGVLARAARLAGLAVHAPVFLSNHYHLLVSVVDSQQLAEFMNYLNSRTQASNFRRSAPLPKGHYVPMAEAAESRHAQLADRAEQ